MKRISTKTAAEAVLRELPSVLGAYVSEDMEGHPREIHLLVRHGPEPGSLARDIRNLLEERLGIPIDQRVISIAQLAQGRDADGTPANGTEGDDAASATAAPGGAAGTDPGSDLSAVLGTVDPFSESEPGSEAGGGKPGAGGRRPIFGGLEATVSAGHVDVGVRLEWEGEVAEGHAEAVDTQPGRARAAASATLAAAVETAVGSELRFELDFASIVQALDGEYVLVSALGISPQLGRRPLPLVGAHPIESDVETAAALATLKAINRVLSLALD